MTISRVARWPVRILGVVVVVALATTLALRVYGSRRLARAERDFLAKVGPVGANPYASASVPDEENAAILLRAGSEAVVLPGNDKPLAGDLTMNDSMSWNAQQVNELRRILAANAPALELLRRAAPMTKSSFGLVDLLNESEELKTKMPLLKLLWGQRLLLLDARLALLDRDWRHFLTDANSMSTMAAALQRESPMVAMLVGLAAEKILLYAAREAAARPDVPLQTLRDVQGLLPGTDLHAVWRRALLVSAVGVEQRTAAVTADPKRRAGEGSALKGRIVDFLFPDVLIAQQRELYSDLLGGVDQPLGSNPHWADRGKVKQNGIFQVFESVIFPQTAISAGRVQSTMSSRNLANVALRIRIEGLQTGAYPETLASFPEALRPDPLAGKPLTYVRRANGSASLTVPDFGALWKRISDVGPGSQPYIWELPAPAKASPGSASGK